MSGARGKQTETTIQSYLHNLGQGEDKILESYSQDAILLTSAGIYQGQEAIKRYYRSYIEDTLPLLAASYSLSRFDVVGEAGYLVWSAQPSIPMGTDTFLVHLGKIVLHTTSMHMNP